MKAGIKHYWKPTPKKLRKLGDALLATATFVSGLSIIHDYRTIALIAVAIGSIGKFLTNFFTEQ